MSESDNADTKNPTSASQQASSAAPGSPAETTAATPSFEEQLAAAKKEAADNYNRYLRSVADLENFRKRSLREKDELRQYAAGRIIEDLLPALDNLSLGMAAARQPNADAKTIAGGVDMVLNQLKSALAGHGLKEVNPQGQPFDPHQHEAISRQPSDSVPAEQVLTVVRAGFTLNGRLLRPATVIVSGGLAHAPSEAPSA